MDNSERFSIRSRKYSSYHDLPESGVDWLIFYQIQLNEDRWVDVLLITGMLCHSECFIMFPPLIVLCVIAVNKESRRCSVGSSKPGYYFEIMISMKKGELKIMEDACARARIFISLSYHLAKEDIAYGQTTQTLCHIHSCTPEIRMF